MASRNLPGVTLTIAVKECVECGVEVIDCGLTPICSDRCMAVWIRRERPKPDEANRAVIDFISREMRKRIDQILADNSHLTMEDLVEAAKEALDETMDGHINISCEVSI